MWTKLNEMMLKHEIPKPKFKGFMVDDAQANWNVVKIIYGSKDPLLGWLIRNTLVYSIRLSHSIGIVNN